MCSLAGFSPSSSAPQRTVRFASVVGASGGVRGRACGGKGRKKGRQWERGVWRMLAAGAGEGRGGFGGPRGNGGALYFVTLRTPHSQDASSRRQREERGLARALQRNERCVTAPPFSSLFCLLLLSFTLAFSWVLYALLIIAPHDHAPSIYPTKHTPQNTPTAPHIKGWSRPSRGARSQAPWRSASAARA